MVIELEQELKVSIDGKQYFAELATVDPPDMETEDHGIFILSAICHMGSSGQGIQVILDDPKKDDNGEFLGRFMDEKGGQFIKAYINFWGPYTSFQKAHGDAFVLREERYNGYIRGLMSKDMKKSIIFADYFK